MKRWYVGGCHTQPPEFKNNFKFLFGSGLTQDDDGITGTSFNRPGLNAMLEEIKAGNVATVIIKEHCVKHIPKIIFGSYQTHKQKALLTQNTTPLFYQSRFRHLKNLIVPLQLVKRHRKKFVMSTPAFSARSFVRIISKVSFRLLWICP